MKKYFLASVSNTTLDIYDYVDEKFNDILRSFKDELYNSNNIDVEIKNIGIANAIVSIDERDFNRFVLMNKQPFHRHCRDFYIKVVGRSEIYFRLHKMIIEWDEIDQDGNLL